MTVFQPMSLRKNSLQYGDLSRMRSQRRASSVSSCTPIDGLEKKWMLFSSACQLNDLQRLTEKDPKLIYKKDFVTGYTATHWAAKHGDTDVLKWLCKQGADVNAKSNGGYTPLHLAVMHGNDDTINALINDFSADINSRDHSGRKPRHYLKKDTSQWAQRVLKATPSVIVMRVDPSANVVTNPMAMNKPPSHAPDVVHANCKAKEETKQDEPELKEKRKKRSLSLAASFKHKRRQDRIKSSESSRVLPPSSPALETKGTPKLRSKSTSITIEHPHFQNETGNGDDGNDEGTVFHGSAHPSPATRQREQFTNDWKVVTMV